MYEQEMKLAKEAAQKAGKFLRTQVGKFQVEASLGRDIKLSSDRHSEEIILETLSPTGYPVLSEESGMTGAASGLRYWIVDPLDGTANYWKGMPDLSCVSVALCEDNHPVLGVVCRFFRDELFSGIVGEGAWRNGVPIHPGDTGTLSQAVLATGFPLCASYDEKTLTGMMERIRRFKKIRMLGTAALMGTFVAEGRVDVYMEEHIMLWDIAAAAAIVKAAGGVAEILPLEKWQCTCRLFANRALREEYTCVEREVNGCSDPISTQRVHI